MNTCESIFDHISSTHKRSPILNSSDFIEIDPECVICESDLWECQKDNFPELRHCVLLKNSIISSRITEKEEECTFETQDIHQIWFNWPTLRKIQYEKFAGFVLIAKGKKIGKFLFATINDANLWLTGLKDVCVQQNIEHEYITKGRLYSGNNTVIKKAIHKSSGKIVAIKCYSKQDLLEKPSLLVFFRSPSRIIE